jgi:hypothetical protein
MVNTAVINILDDVCTLVKCSDTHAHTHTCIHTYLYTHISTWHSVTHIIMLNEAAGMSFTINSVKLSLCLVQ